MSPPSTPFLTPSLLLRILTLSGWSTDTIESLSLSGLKLNSLGCIDPGDLGFVSGFSVEGGGSLGLSKLVCLNLSRNNLNSLNGISADLLPSLIDLTLYYNNLSSLLSTLDILSGFSLENLDMRLNPICQEEGYRRIVVKRLKKLSRLDETNIKAKERRWVADDGSSDDESISGLSEEIKSSKHARMDNASDYSGGVDDIDLEDDKVHTEDSKTILPTTKTTTSISTTKNSETPLNILSQISDALASSAEAQSTIITTHLPSIAKTINDVGEAVKVSVLNEVGRVVLDSLQEVEEKKISSSEMETQTDGDDGRIGVFDNLRRRVEELEAEKDSLNGKIMGLENDLREERGRNERVETLLGSLVERSNGGEEDRNSLKTTLNSQAKTIELLKSSQTNLLETNKRLLKTVEEKDNEMKLLADSAREEGRIWRRNFEVVLAEARQGAKR